MICQAKPQVLTQRTLSLPEFTQLCSRLHLLPPPGKQVIVAGTNGKGTFIHQLNKQLRAHDVNVFCFTSPHLLKVNERFVFNDLEIRDTELNAIKQMIDYSTAELPLTYFERLTLMAMRYVQVKQPDVCIWEVGIGGLHDAVNAIDADIAVVTQVDFDHTELLGSSYEAIATQKCGIARRSKPLFIDDVRLLEIARKTDADVCLTEDVIKSVTERLDVDWKQLPKSLPTGRRTWLRDDLLVDVAHNPSACAYLAEYLSAYPCEGKIWGVFAFAKGKDQIGACKALSDTIDYWLPCEFDALPEGGVSTVRYALRQKAENDRVIVFGSFHTVAAVLQMGL